ncbi:MAG: four-carbon acid sugar kinase family protein [Acidobacteria bacterium]|nr:four-carbon acid sugar kinase family protein [Acidobacteriota bacterium]
MSLLFAAIADDDTGATDIAGMLAQQGVRTLLVLEGASDEELREWAGHADAVVIGTASRNIPPQEAYDRTAAAIARITPFAPKTFFIKYCSTFDSTDAGNIGPSIDATMDALQQTFTIALPALPVNGRTTYMGHHFVGAQLLSESSMRHHPLTPMTESDLVVHLQKQTKRNVSLIDLHTVRKGTGAIRERIVALTVARETIAIVDCTCEEDLAAIGEAVTNARLLSGSSALASVLPASWKAQGLLKGTRHSSLQRKSKPNTGFFAAAGSCSAATQQQNAHAAAHSWIVIDVETVALASGADLSEKVLTICNKIERGENVLVKTTSTAPDVEHFRKWCDARGISQAEGGEKISRGLAALVRDVVDRSGPQGVLIAGGETSGAACRALNIRALTVGEQIAPGVPVCMPLSGMDVPIALKSGNFGGEDFYERAIRVMRALPIGDER